MVHRGKNLVFIDMFRHWVSHEPGFLVITTGVDKVLADSAVQVFPQFGVGNQMYRIPTSVVGPLVQDSVLLTEGILVRGHDCQVVGASYRLNTLLVIA